MVKNRTLTNWYCTIWIQYDNSPYEHVCFKYAPKMVSIPQQSAFEGSRGRTQQP